MPRADVIEMSRCRSTELGKCVQDALRQLGAFEAGATRDQIAPQEDRQWARLQAAEEAASWAKPDSAGGALVHLLLAASDVEDLPRANPEYLERLERTVCRNLYAVRDFLLRQMSDADRAALHELTANYMAQDPHSINPALASGVDSTTDVAGDQFNVA